MIEILAGLFITSIVLVYLIPNIVNEYKILNKAENNLKMKEILYEEILFYEDYDIYVVREDYEIIVKKDSASIENLKTGDKLSYE